MNDPDNTPVEWVSVAATAVVNGVPYVAVHSEVVADHEHPVNAHNMAAARARNNLEDIVREKHPAMSLRAAFDHAYVTSTSHTSYYTARRSEAVPF